MEESLDLEKKANLYAGRQLRALRGDETRVAFSQRIGIQEAQLYKFERGMIRLTIGKMTCIASILGVPFSHFLLPEDDPAFERGMKINVEENTA